MRVPTPKLRRGVIVDSSRAPATLAGPAKSKKAVGRVAGSSSTPALRAFAPGVCIMAT